MTPGAAQTSAGDEPAIVADGVVKRYGGRTVLDGISLTVRRGELVAFIGPNGAGKTTTVEILEGYRRADAGTIRVLGMDPATAGPALRARVGLMLQGGGGMDPRSLPIEILRLYARFHVPARDPEELLDLVGLRAAARTRFRGLSGGERQRLALALALVGEPELLILDEPTAGMDPEARATTRAIIGDLRAAGRTILLTTHDLTDVERMADRVAILDRGRIVALGSPAELTAGGVPALTVRLAADVVDAAVGSALETALAARFAGVRTTPLDGGSFRVDGAPPSAALVAAVTAWLAERDLLVADLRTTAGSLEDRYLELTGDRAVERAA